MGWYYRDEDENVELGPIEENGEGRVPGLDVVISEGLIGPDTYVSQGDGNWQRASETELANRSSARIWKEEHQTDWRRELELTEGEEVLYECPTDNMWVTNRRVVRGRRTILTKDIQTVTIKKENIAQRMRRDAGRDPITRIVNLVADAFYCVLGGWLFVRVVRWWESVVQLRIPYLPVGSDVYNSVVVRSSEEELLIYECPIPPALPWELRKWEKHYRAPMTNQHEQLDPIINAISRARAECSA